jgi:hypothetical protein
MHRHLVVMARVPTMGRVKTRLAAGIGAVAATAFYRRELAALLRRVGGDPRWTTWLAVTPDTGVALPGWRRGPGVIAQGSGDLGARMGRVMRTLPPGPVLIVGSDIPELAPADIAAGFAALGSHDAVFGPAPDGGYWLVGLRRTPRVLDPFGGVRWSDDHALADTVRNLKGRRIAFLRELADIDTAEDYFARRRGAVSRQRSPPHAS